MLMPCMRPTGPATAVSAAITVRCVARIRYRKTASTMPTTIGAEYESVTRPALSDTHETISPSSGVAPHAKIGTRKFCPATQNTKNASSARERSTSNRVSGEKSSDSTPDAPAVPSAVACACGEATVVGDPAPTASPSKTPSAPSVGITSSSSWLWSDRGDRRIAACACPPAFASSDSAECGLPRGRPPADAERGVSEDITRFAFAVSTKTTINASIAPMSAAPRPTATPVGIVSFVPRMKPATAPAIDSQRITLTTCCAVCQGCTHPAT
mmetsp:Transcript_7125/g.25388  ORF Transcript_7125/g.25388 Transcript_7125/m.25388 type:complete len:270 (+) Transcript_7125:1854-2663(+)